MNPYEETLLRARDAERADEIRSLQTSGTVVHARLGWFRRVATALFGKLRRSSRPELQRPPAPVLDTVDQPAVAATVK